MAIADTKVPLFKGHFQIKTKKKSRGKARPTTGR